MSIQPIQPIQPVQPVQPVQPFLLERYFARYEFCTRFLLSSSDCESIRVADLLALEPDAAGRLQDLWLGYTESAGAPALRQAVAATMPGLDPDQVLITSGAEEAIYWVVQALLRPGDHLIVHTPCYQSHQEVARAAGAAVTPWLAREEQGWALDLDDLRRLIRPQTRAVLINTPHNPTGWLMTQADWRALHALTAAHGLTVISDEVYRESELAADDRLPAACTVSPTAVTIGAVSKAHGLPGLRIGWVATQDAALLQRITSCKDYTTICNSAPSELLAEIALRHRAVIIGRNLAIVRRNLALLDDFFARRGDRFRWQRPRATAVAFPQLLRADGSSVGSAAVDAFCDRVVREAGVLLAPGSLFGDAGSHFRIGFGRANLPAALAAWENVLERW